MTIDTRLTLSRASDELLATCMTVEGISGALRAAASDMDGMRLMTPIQATRLCELLAGECGRVTHRLGLIHDLIEAAAEDRQEGAENG